MPSLDFNNEKVNFYNYYNEKYSLFSDAVKSYKTLLSLLLTDNDDFATPSVIGRVKNKEECISKFCRKYLTGCEEKKEPYEIKSYLTDIIGLRVTCHYERDIQLIRNIIKDNFSIVSETDKTQIIESHDDTFGYKGYHLDLKLSENRSNLPEYKRFNEYQFEVQIRTIVQDAWSSLDHKIKYKKIIPPNLKRRINRLAALFELADQEFENIRNETNILELKNKQNSLDVGNVIKEQKFDAFSFLRIVQTYFPDYRFHNYKIDDFVDELYKVNSSITYSDIDNALKDKEKILENYILYQQEKYFNRFNPYTEIRHALYILDKDIYTNLLFDSQRVNFDKWLVKHKGE